MQLLTSAILLITLTVFAQCVSATASISVYLNVLNFFIVSGVVFNYCDSTLYLLNMYTLPLARLNVFFVCAMHCIDPLSVFFLFVNRPVVEGLCLRYDTRCYFNVRSKADISRLNLPHKNDN